MSTPRADRPYIPGYGVAGPDEGTGLLPWSWATERLGTTRDHWLATVGANGWPHVSPVWGVWLDDCVWFSCSPASRKARNLSHEPRCVVTTDDPERPVIVEGIAELVDAREAIEHFTERSNDKYEVDYPVDFYLEQALFRVYPRRVFALDSDDFTGSPTRFTIEDD